MKALLILSLTIAGCTTLPADPTAMTPDQLKEWVKDKSASVSCVVARNMSGTVAMSTTSLDKASIAGGTVTVKPGNDCETTITSDFKPAVHAKPASAP